METTDILKLKKPSQNDFYNVNDFNANMDILEGEAAKAKSRQATLLVHAPAGYSIEVVHQSCAYTAVSTAVGNDAWPLPGGCSGRLASAFTKRPDVPPSSSVTGRQLQRRW